MHTCAFSDPHRAAAAKCHTLSVWLAIGAPMADTAQVVEGRS
jgi:hypothetical protein